MRIGQPTLGAQAGGYRRRVTAGPVASSELASRRMKNTPTRDTPAELALRRILHSMGLRYRVDARADPALRRRADIVFSGAKVAVFVDGCFWHACPDHGSSPKANAVWWKEKLRTNVARDRDTDRASQVRWLGGGPSLGA